MPSVFLSYSRVDVPLIEQLVAHLRASSPEVSIWRDQEKIYGRQKWPKILGEAIADQNVFLLAWPKNAASSHFVELEWNAAIGLRKAIILCLLDDTPLAPSLRAFHGYPMQDVAGLTTSLATAPPVDLSRRTPVLAKLDDITSLDETAVLAQAKAVFAQQQWTIQGNVYQAGGDIHIHNEPSTLSTAERANPIVQYWQAWMGLAVAVLTAVILLDLPTKWEELTPSTVHLEQPLAGMVLDEGTEEPLVNVVISLPGFDMTRMTEGDGSFRFPMEKGE